MRDRCLSLLSHDVSETCADKLNILYILYKYIKQKFPLESIQAACRILITARYSKLPKSNDQWI